MERINYLKEEAIMQSLKEQLMEVWKEERDALADMAISDKNKEMYREQANRVNELEKRLVDLEKAELEVESKAASQDIDEGLKTRQMEEDKKDRLIRNGVEIAKVVIPVIGASVMAVVSMKWEKLDTLTSTAGKSALRDVLKFK